MEQHDGGRMSVRCDVEERSRLGPTASGYDDRVVAVQQYRRERCWSVGKLYVATTCFEQSLVHEGAKRVIGSREDGSH
jgi:hypothetical protein